MNRRTKYAEDGGEIAGRLRVIPDFLPAPAELARAERPETVKVTLELDRTTVDWFKAQADKHGGSYQRMIRNLAGQYARQAAAKVR